MGLTDRVVMRGRLAVWSWPDDVDVAELCKRHPRERRGGRLALVARNLVTTNGKSLAAGLLGGVSAYTSAQYLALGSGAGTPAVGDTALFSEQFRKVFAGVFGGTAAVDCSTFLLQGDANFTWTEAALFGDGATGTSGSGLMITHALVSPNITKTSTQQYTVDYNITMS